MRQPGPAVHSDALTGGHCGLDGSDAVYQLLDCWRGEVRYRQMELGHSIRREGAFRMRPFMEADQHRHAVGRCQPRGQMCGSVSEPAGPPLAC